MLLRTKLLLLLILTLLLHHLLLQLLIWKWLVIYENVGISWKLLLSGEWSLRVLTSGWALLLHTWLFCALESMRSTAYLSRVLLWGWGWGVFPCRFSLSQLLSLHLKKLAHCRFAAMISEVLRILLLRLDHTRFLKRLKTLSHLIIGECCIEIRCSRLWLLIQRALLLLELIELTLNIFNILLLLIREHLRTVDLSKSLTIHLSRRRQASLAIRRVHSKVVITLLHVSICIWALWINAGIYVCLGVIDISLRRTSAHHHQIFITALKLHALVARSYLIELLLIRSSRKILFFIAICPVQSFRKANRNLLVQISVLLMEHELIQRLRVIVAFLSLNIQLLILLLRSSLNLTLVGLTAISSHKSLLLLIDTCGLVHLLS